MVTCISIFGLGILCCIVGLFRRFLMECTKTINNLVFNLSNCCFGYVNCGMFKGCGQHIMSNSPVVITLE